MQKEEKGVGIWTLIEKWHLRVDKAFAFMSGMVIFVMMLFTSMDVIFRYTLNAPIKGNFELMELLLPVAALLGISYVQAIKGHISVEFITERLSAKAAARLDVIVLLIALITAVLLVRQSTVSAMEFVRVGERTMGVVEYPMGPSKIAVALGLGLFCLRIIEDLVRAIVKVSRLETKNRGDAS